MFHARMLAAIDGARTLANMDELSKTIWQAHSGGAVDDDGAQALAEALHARRTTIRGALKPVGIPLGRQSLFPPKRPQRAPDRTEALSRRRRLAASGPMPPALACRFTVGQLSVLRIVADEIATKGVCGLCVDAIAARAGVSRRLAQGAIREAEGDGLLVIQERRHEGRKNDPNLVRIISHEWRQWIERGQTRKRNGFASRPAGTHRVQKDSPHGYPSSKSALLRAAEPKKGCREPAGDATTRDKIGIRSAGGNRRAMR
ncbi:hypothetical protein [Methylobacterium sp. WL9]|uniref:hypothetical protein n=1 Tax=Methylobacterium sp. WL9 TaxID=2603898 RepID=UPI0011CA4D97|nr:hypothetical protein [Methylobacterium sp. WL9]TXN21023.1 hypothetical protein FV217_15815 [Methylobacterium sp. WL9]